MPDIIHEINCNLQWRQRQTIYTKQGEYGARKVRIYLYDGPNKYDVPSSGLSAVFAYKRPDGFNDAYDTIDGASAIDLSAAGDYATVTLAQQVLAVAGVVDCELQLLTANSLTATFTFQISVEASVSPGVEPSSQTTNPFVRSLADVGSGYAICGTAAATAAKTATINGYKLTSGGRVSIRFDNAVPANATLNISDTGAKYIYYHGSKVTGSLIGAGDLVTFVYAGGCYHVAAIDAAGSGGSGADLPDLYIGDLGKVLMAVDSGEDDPIWGKAFQTPIRFTITQSGTSYTVPLGTYTMLVQAISDNRLVEAVTPYGIARYCGDQGTSESHVFVFDVAEDTNDVIYSHRFVILSTNVVSYIMFNIDNSLVTRESIGAEAAVIHHTITGAQPEITPVAGHAYHCGEVASIQITASFASTGDWMVEFDTPQNVGCAVDLPSALKLATGAPSTFARAKHYEINTHNGYAVIGEF